MPGSLPQCMARIRAVSVVIVCASETVVRQRSEQVTNHARAQGPLSTLKKKSIDTHSNRCLVFRDALSEGFRHFVSSMPAPVASGWSESPGGACTLRELNTEIARSPCKQIEPSGIQASPTERAAPTSPDKQTPTQR
jgi:hypothetical protein